MTTETRSEAKHTRTMEMNDMAMEYKQEELNIPGTKSEEKWYTITEMAKILGVSYEVTRYHLKKIDVTSHSKHTRTKGNTPVLSYDEYVFKHVSACVRHGKEMAIKNDAIFKYQSEIRKLKQDVQREKIKRAEYLEKYSKHLDYIVSIKNEYSAMQKRIVELETENGELKAELAHKPVWKKLFT